ncbi:hypothetical protein VTK73DRAFT_9867 [Phialemonium thermophilum]|uniref:Uncharacterized protein n=1 Tax=Phialemonium thermophilum TaxID=223376 RepID=A0ABR3XIH0_9PEZI
MAGVADKDSAALWDEIEAKYWRSIQAVRAREDREYKEAYQAKAQPVTIELTELYLERHRLEDQLKAVNERCREAESRLTELENENEKYEQYVTKQRALDDEEKRSWFETYRAGECPQPSRESDESTAADELVDRQEDSSVELSSPPSSAAISPPESEVEAPEQHKDPETQATGPQAIGGPNCPTDIDKTPAEPETRDTPTGIEICDADGRTIGELQRLNRDNPRIDKICRFPPKRRVQVRPGRSFTAEHLKDVHSPADNRLSKWFSCYIQAAGQVQAQPCQFCTKGSGPFSECVIIGGEFPRCSNCEWGRQGCHGASVEGNTGTRHNLGGNTGSSSAAEVDSGQATSPGNIAGSAPSNGTRGVRMKRTPRHLSMQRVDDLYSPASAEEGRGQVKSNLTKATAKEKTGDLEEPAPNTPENHPSYEGQVLPEITKDTLELRHDDVVFTDPPCMRGVPLIKITPEHAYWEPDWTSLEEEVRTQLEKAKERRDQCYLDRTMPSHNKHLANRQVNRGEAVLKFLRDGDFHPYQLIGKEWITKSVFHYDILFRMVQTLTELAKFDVEIRPSDWLRQRLHEIYSKDCDRFDLAKALQNMYHDPKLVHLRVKNGFGNIGRPPGGKSKKDIEGVNGSATHRNESNGTKKRKEPHVTPKKTGVEQAQVTTPSPSLGPAQRASRRKDQRNSAESSATKKRQQQQEGRSELHQEQLQKKQKIEHHPVGNKPSSAILQRDLEYDGYTSTDSFSGDRVVRIDWRVYQIKTRRMTSNPAVTQYWHWLDEADNDEGESPFFEHQVLGDVSKNKVSWGVYKEPNDFHLRLGELTEATYSPDSQKVIFSTRPMPGAAPRGDLLAHFKRENTKRRFLRFIRTKGVPLVRTNKEYIESAWDRLPDYNGI